MEKLAAKLSERLYQEKIIADDEREVYQYCIEVTISTVSYWASILICAVLLGKLWESVVYLGAFMVMRFCFGGYHASTHFRCALVSMASYGIFFGIGSCYAFCRDFSIKWGLAYLIIISLKCQIK